MVMELTQLGQRSEIPDSPALATIETIPNQHRSTAYCVRFTCTEFTSLCPVTGQPDFAHIVIDYIPHHRLVESKSLKLFLHSFRSEPSFHEDCVATIAKKLYSKTDPYWMRVVGLFFPRGGIPIDVFFTLGQIPDHGVHIPTIDRDYRGR